MARTSEKRQEILRFLTQFSEERGYAPSVREIMQAVGLRSTASVQYHLNALEEQGLIRAQGGKNRSLCPTQPRGIPVLGVVTAGQPILAVENIEGYLPWSGDGGCFALRVRGDSMIGAGILDGDRVIVRPQPTAQHGEIVVALLGEEATVKRLCRRDGKILLLPENPNYSPIDGTEVTILGKVKAVYRDL